MQFFPKLLVAVAAFGLATLAMAGGHEAAMSAGEDIFDTNCAKCHQGFFAGIFSDAPRIDDEEAWAPRAAKGADSLTSTTIAGIGEMAARGGCDTCTDDDIRAAVEYMLEQGK